MLTDQSRTGYFCRFAIQGGAPADSACVMPVASHLLPHSQRWSEPRYYINPKPSVIDFSSACLGLAEGFAQAGCSIDAAFAYDPARDHTWKVTTLPPLLHLCSYYEVQCWLINQGPPPIRQTLRRNPPPNPHRPKHENPKPPPLRPQRHAPDNPPQHPGHRQQCEALGGDNHRVKNRASHPARAGRVPAEAGFLGLHHAAVDVPRTGIYRVLPNAVGAVGESVCCAFEDGLSTEVWDPA